MGVRWGVRDFFFSWLLVSFFDRAQISNRLQIPFAADGLLGGNQGVTSGTPCIRPQTPPIMTKSIMAPLEARQQRFVILGHCVGGTSRSRAGDSRHIGADQDVVRASFSLRPRPGTYLAPSRRPRAMLAPLRAGRHSPDSGLSMAASSSIARAYPDTEVAANWKSSRGSSSKPAPSVFDLVGHAAANVAHFFHNCGRSRKSLRDGS